MVSPNRRLYRSEESLRQEKRDEFDRETRDAYRRVLAILNRCHNDDEKLQRMPEIQREFDGISRWRY